MKHLFFSFTLITFIISCQSMKEEKGVVEDSIASVQQVSEPEPTQIKPSILTGTSTWKGTINAKIPMTITLTLEDTVVYGTVEYKNSGKPITLLGHRDGPYISLQEFYKSKDVTGIYHGEIKNDTIISGTWYTGKYDLEKVDEGKYFELKIESVANNKVPVHSGNVAGTYAFQFGGENGASGNLDVEVIGDSISLGFDCLTHGPAFNMANITVKEKFSGNHLEVERNGEYYSEDGNCKFEVFFMPGGAFVRHFENGLNCGFGFNASLHGIYYKVD